MDAQILRLLNEHTEDGLSNARLLQEVSNSATPEDTAESPSSVTEQLGSAINRLLAQGTIEMLRETTTGEAAGGGAGFILRLKRGSQLSNASPEEQLVFSIIEESQRMGVWIRDIRERSGLNEVQLRRLLKALEQRKLVRSIKAAGTTKKTYILSSLEADDTLTGGTFYSDQQLDSEFVQTLLHVCVNWLLQRRRTAEEKHPDDSFAQRDASFVESDEVARYIHEKGLCRIQLGVADVERQAVLDIGVLDGKIEKRLNHTYRAIRKQQLRPSPLASVPCLQCPVSAECTPGLGRLISPENCEYFRLHFDL
uniref:DNA-directed RNA polymerase III subunit RPC6 n=1 Tax=Globodera pallida TaxID=36090 RepID=A0A183C1L5_GLOPA